MQHISRQFNRAATSYREAACVQPEVGKRLIERLDYINLQPRTMIDLGCGTGAQLNELATHYPQAELLGVDFAEKMLHQAALQSPHKLINAQAQHLPFANNSVDLIFSNLMFQWCDPLLPVLQECYRVLREGGLLMFTSFGPDTLQELRYSWAQVDQYPHVNEFVDMHYIGDWLLQTYFNDPVMDMEYISVTYNNIIDLMRDLQNIGATYCDPNRRKTLTGKNKFQQVAHHYQQFAIAENRLPATYEIIYGHAWKLPRPQSANEIFIPVERIGKK